MQSTIKIGILWICLLGVSLISCKKYLSSYSQNLSFVETAEDLNELLIGDAYLDRTKDVVTELFYLMDDDIEIGIPTTSTILAYNHGTQYWQAEPRMNSIGDIANTDTYYNGIYAKIARINTILLESEKLRSNGESAVVLNRISGEAHFLRALYYFTLANFYGKPYKPATAHSDFSVPLKVAPAITGQFVTRSSVKDVFQQIVHDLEKADGLLPENQPNSALRASKAAASGLLSRVHLHMENYEKSVEYANRVIALDRFRLTDLNTFSTGQFFLNVFSTEAIFTMGPNTDRMNINQDIPTFSHLLVSTNLYSSFDAKDLRKQVFFKINSRGSARAIKYGGGASNGNDAAPDKYSLRLAEMYLNKAEALAVLGRQEEARSAIQHLHKFRFKPTDIPVLNEAGAELVQKIREERRKELCFEGQRWFDLRRYGVNSKFPYGTRIKHRSIIATAIGHVENGYYELGTYAEDEAAYTFPIANDEIEFNQGRIVNEIRPDRPLKQ